MNKRALHRELLLLNLSTLLLLNFQKRFDLDLFTRFINFLTDVIKISVDLENSLILNS